jgi:hypothetical protein
MPEKTVLLKEFKQSDDEWSGICPECNHINSGSDGCSVNGDEGSFFWCSYCRKPSVLIHNGAFFTFHGTVYEIKDNNNQGIKTEKSLISAIEVRRPGASPLWKPSPRGYQYFTRDQIILSMSEQYRDDL